MHTIVGSHPERSAEKQRGMTDLALVEVPQAEEQHARLELNIKHNKLISIVVVDLKTTSGTFVNDQRIVKGGKQNWLFSGKSSVQLGTGLDATTITLESK